MSRRFSTLDYPMKDQKDMTNDVRLKLAKVRARSRSTCVSGPAPPLANTSSTSAELKKSKRSSQVPRSSITAMTTSAKAKVRSPYTNTNDRPTKNNSKSSNFLSSSPPTNTLEPNNNNRRRHSTASNNNSSNNHYQRIKSAPTTQWNEDTTLIKFFDSDSDEDELFLRNYTKAKSSPQANRHHERNQRRATIATSARVDNADENHNQSLRAELQELKSRLAKLEVMHAPPPPAPAPAMASSSTTTNNKPTTSTTGGTSRRSSMNSSSAFLSPQSSLVDSACSVSKTQIPTQYEEVLQGTVRHLENHLQQDDPLGDSNGGSKNTENTPFMDTLIALVAETMNINQTLASLAFWQQASSDDLLTVKKSSDHQIKLLTKTLQALTAQQQQQPQPQQLKQYQGQLKQHQVMDPLASPPLSRSGSINNDMGIDDSPKPSKHRVLFSSPTVSHHLPKTSTNQSQQLHTTHHINNSQQSSSSSSSTDKKRNSTNSTVHNSIRFKDHEVTPAKHQQTRSVNGILYYPHHHQQQQQQEQQQQQHHEKEKRKPFYSLPSFSVVKQKIKSSSQQQQQQPLQAFYPMSSSRVNQLLSKYESLLKPTTTTTTASSKPAAAAAHQLHVDRDRFPSFIDY